MKSRSHFTRKRDNLRRREKSQLSYKGWKKVKLSPMEQSTKNGKGITKLKWTTLNMISSVTNFDCLAQY